MADPLRYYDENVAKSIRFIEHLVAVRCLRLIFSSSASVYEVTDAFVVDESAPLAPSSPYGRTKAIIEAVLHDSAIAYGLRVLCLRYFNPIGADPALRSGDPRSCPSHVFGRIAQAGRDDVPFRVFGTDWPTPDGTPIRDFIHIWDLASAHVRVVDRFNEIAAHGTCRAINIGTGVGTTIAELVTAHQAMTGLPTVITGDVRRSGDVAGTYANVDLMKRLLDWQPELTIQDAIIHATAWHRRLAPNTGRDPSTDQGGHGCSTATDNTATY